MKSITGPPDRTSALVIGGTALLAFLVFANSLANGFAYDDVWIIQNRELVHSLTRLPELFTTDYWASRFGSGLYRPFTLLTFALDWQLWAGDPFGFHLTNVLLNAAVTAAATALLLRFFPWWAALLGGAVFAVHPLHTEAVANVVGRAELLTALFVVAAGLIYVAAVRRDAGLGPGSLAAIAVLYAFALFSKELGVVLPALLLVLDLPELARRGFSRLGAYVHSRAPLIIILALILLAYLGIRWRVLGAPLGGVPDWFFAADASFGARFFTMARVWPRYLQLAVFPLDLSADYSPAVILPVSRLTPLGALGIGLVATIVILAVIALRRRPEFSVAVLWAGIALLPVSNLVFVSEIVLAERTLYLPSLALSIAVAVSAVASRPRLRRWLVAGLAIWIAGACVVAAKRNRVWQSTESVFADMLEHHPESVRVIWWLGGRRLRRGDWEEARQLYYRALEIWPYQGQYISEFAVYLLNHGELDEAERMAERAIPLAPNYADNWVLLVVIRLRRGDTEGALQAAKRAREVIGPSPLLDWLRADAFEQRGDFAAAASAIENSIEGKGANAKWQDWARLARLRAAAGDTASALAALDSAARLPGSERTRVDSLRALIRRSR